MSTQSLTRSASREAEKTKEAVLTGPAVAAMIAGGAGVFVTGLMTTLAEASEAIKNALNIVKPVGPLSGKTIAGVLVWLVTWFLLNTILKDKDSDLVKGFVITIVLVVLGLLLTFPPFFEIFAAE